MNEIKAVIQPSRLGAVIDVIREHPELSGVTVSDGVIFGDHVSSKRRIRDAAGERDS